MGMWAGGSICLCVLANMHSEHVSTWKATRQSPATEEQLARMEASVAKNAQE